jgi:hypothetical protein
MAKHVELPAEIKVGGLVFTVEVVRDLKSADKACHGTMDWNRQRICLDAEMPSKEFVANIVIHELMHALWQYYDLPTKYEETSVFRLSNGLSAVLKDNPELFNYILKAYK